MIREIPNDSTQDGNETLYLLKFELSRLNIYFSKGSIVFRIERRLSRRSDDNIPLISPPRANNIVHASIAIPEWRVTIQLFHNDEKEEHVPKKKIRKVKSRVEGGAYAFQVRASTHLTKINRFPADFIVSKTCFKCGFSSKYFSGSLATNL
jgi:hypothetical protein